MQANPAYKMAAPMIIYSTKKNFLKWIIFVVVSAVSLYVNYYAYTHGYADYIKRYYRLPVNNIHLHEINNTHDNETVHKSDVNTNTKMKVRELLEKFDELSRTDISQPYRFAPNIIAPPPNVDELVNSTTVTLCTHTSDNHLHYIEELAEYWGGPISVSVFTTQEKVDIVLYTIVRIRNCHPLVRKFVRFHVAFMSRYPLNLKQNRSFDLNCNSSENVLADDTTQNYNGKHIYPNNLLRTIALQCAQTAFVTSLDIDLIPSKNLSSMLQMFLRNDGEASSNWSKVAYVLPCFEYIAKTFRPMSKAKVVELWPDNIQTFYVNTCTHCHLNTDYDRWIALNNSDTLDVAYTAQWALHWEPFYVARKKGLPMFDAQFKNFGYNRMSQICEMYVSGYTFKVLNNGFVVHRGLKLKTNSRRKMNSQEHLRNKQLFEHVFIVELHTRYPDSTRTCINSSKYNKKPKAQKPMRNKKKANTGNTGMNSPKRRLSTRRG